MTDQSILREIQLAVLGMLREFDAVCKRNGIRYFAMCGTLLGAVRNQGFIPWDDDVDLAILREDFNKLKRLPREEWGEKLEFITAADDDLRHDHIFPRVYLKNSRIQSYDDVENWIDPTTGKAWSTGLFLDLYIFERISDNDREYRRTLAMGAKTERVYKGCKLEANYQTAAGLRKGRRFYRYLYGKIARAIWKTPWRRLDRRLSARIEAAGKGEQIGCYYAPFGIYGGFDSYKLREEDIFPLGRLPFEDMMVPVPHHTDVCLAKDFGADYMVPPPENNRTHIDFVYADLADGRVLIVDPIPGSLGARTTEKQGQERA